MIKPTIGRIVWYTPEMYVPSNSNYGTQPFAAIVTYVHSDRMVNLSVFDHTGEHYSVRSVTLVQDDDETRPSDRYCEWMPYQIGQAKKHEESSK